MRFTVRGAGVGAEHADPVRDAVLASFPVDPASIRVRVAAQGVYGRRRGRGLRQVWGGFAVTVTIQTEVAKAPDVASYMRKVVADGAVLKSHLARRGVPPVSLELLQEPKTTSLAPPPEAPGSPPRARPDTTLPIAAGAAGALLLAAGVAAYAKRGSDRKRRRHAAQQIRKGGDAGLAGLFLDARGASKSRTASAIELVQNPMRGLTPQAARKGTYRQSVVAFNPLLGGGGGRGASVASPLPDWRDPAPAGPGGALPPGWSTATTAAGEEYYWNPNTGETQWERPTL